MDGRGGCCIARYVGGAHDMSKVDRIMLRFRPIAPKPVVSGSVSADSTPEKTEVAARKGRGKRRYVKDSGGKRCNNRRKKASVENRANDVSVHPAVMTTTTTTLSLLPETPERSEYCGNREGRKAPVWLSFEGGSGSYGGGKSRSQVGLVGDRAVVTVPQPVRMVASWVTVERVTETWVEGEALGWTDKERRRNLERDTCPGFISDGDGKVTWTNGAYREMVGGGEGRAEAVRVWLEMKERAAEGRPAFTCRVKVQYRCRWGKERSSLTVPCDVWRMECGGYAWRLDVKAALSLSLGR